MDELGFLSVGFDVEVVVVPSFEATFTVTDAEDVSVEVVLVPVGVESLTAAMRLYPNPVSDVLANELPISENVTVEIFSGTGLMVLSVDSDAAATRVDVSGLAAGAYFVRVAGHDGLQVLRFVKF